jgi:hypothetical protein
VDLAPDLVISPLVSHHIKAFGNRAFILLLIKERVVISQFLTGFLLVIVSTLACRDPFQIVRRGIESSFTKAQRLDDVFLCKSR